MKASFLDLRKKSTSILSALDRNETVTVLYRGRPKAIMQPIGGSAEVKAGPTRKHPAFGLWADRRDMKDVAAYVRRLRQGRLNDL